jgi:peptide/nickel transport system substrate-binding protein
MRVIKHLHIILAGIISWLMVQSCQAPDKHSNNTVFKYNEAAGITSLDPAFSNRTENIWAVNQIFNGLVQLNDSLVVKPCIAKSWEISDDGLAYTFHLRDDVYFHDHPLFVNKKGRQVIASDFVFSFNRILNPDVASPGVWVLNAVAKKDNKYLINAINDSTLLITLEKPYRPFLNLLSMPYCSVIPHEVANHYQKDFRSNPVGTGPFFFKYWAEGEKVVLLKNPLYFEFFQGKRMPFLDAVNIAFLKDRQTAFLEFIKGNFDFISGIDASYKDELLSRTGKLNKKYEASIHMSKIPFLKTDYLGFNLDAQEGIGKLNKESQLKIRKAINYGFDRKKMVLYLRNNIGAAAINGFIPKGMPGFDENITGFNYNPQLAKKLLAEAGFPDGKNLPEIKLITTSVYVDVCEYLQSELAQIGIKLTVEVLLPAVNSELIANNKAQFFRKSWVADYADKENYMSVFYSKNFSPNGPNYTHFNNTEFDGLYEQCLLLNDADDLQQCFNRMEEIILEEAPVVPLYYDDAVFFYHNHIQGIKGNPLNLLNLKSVKKTNRNESI